MLCVGGKTKCPSETHTIIAHVAEYSGDTFLPAMDSVVRVTADVLGISQAAVSLSTEV